MYTRIDSDRIGDQIVQIVMSRSEGGLLCIMTDRGSQTLHICHHRARAGLRMSPVDDQMRRVFASALARWPLYRPETFEGTQSPPTGSRHHTNMKVLSLVCFGGDLLESASEGYVWALRTTVEQNKFVQGNRGGMGGNFLV